MSGFIHFIREQGVIGLAVGFILGGAVSKVVASLVADIINPLIALIFQADSLTELTIGPIMLGNFIMVVIDFIIIAAVVYYIVHGMKLDTLDKKKES